MFAAGSIAIGVLVVFFVGRMALDNSSVDSALAETKKTGDPMPVVEAITAVDEERRPTKWDYAINRLWQAYARETAAAVIVAAAERSEATILQYWIQQVLQVEPEIAETTFSEEFLETHYRPEVAARCGKSGCCP